MIHRCYSLCVYSVVAHLGQFSVRLRKDVIRTALGNDVHLSCFNKSTLVNSLMELYELWTMSGLNTET
jgi:hypothetical protein